MTYKEKLDITKNWKRRAAIINLYHKLRTLKKNHRWTIRLTASYFKISIGQVSEAIKLAENHELVSECANRKEALLKLR